MKVIRLQAQGFPGLNIHRPRPQDARFWTNPLSVAIWIDRDELEDDTPCQTIIQSAIPVEQKVAQLRARAKQIAIDRFGEKCNELEREGVQIQNDYDANLDTSMDRIDWDSLATPPPPEETTAQSQVQIRTAQQRKQPIAPADVRQFIMVNLPEVSGYLRSQQMMSQLANLLQALANKPRIMPMLISLLRSHNTMQGGRQPLTTAPGVAPPPMPVGGTGQGAGGASGMGSGVM